MIELEDLGVLESDNEYVIEAIVDANVFQMSFSYTVTLHFEGQNDRVFRLTLSGPFQLFIESNWQEVDPDNLNTCHLVFSLHTDTVTSSRVLKSGELRMAFKSGVELVAGANQDYESWEFGMRTDSAPGRSWLMICMPGGEIAVF